MMEHEEKSREVRLGLVMYGGVSLAIYINGVAHEFYRAVRGRGVFKLIKALTDSDIVVDIISGTSAGGINGILLAYALCNDREFGICSGMWRQEGDIRRLLHTPRRPPEKTNSLMDSEGYFQSRLEAVFQEMPSCNKDEEKEPEFSVTKELDLFITGTHVDGQVYTWFDDAGHPVDVKDHRTVFILKHRQGRKEPFNPLLTEDGKVGGDPQQIYKALAKLGRITSCFPVAFQPVTVLGDEAGADGVDSRLRLWGNLHQQACFLDGGVLDNKPFTLTIREIFYRLTDRPVERLLFYVEPDPERFANRKSLGEPNVVQSALRALVNIPGYESISEDLKLLGLHNDKIVRFKGLAADLGKSGLELSDITRDFIKRMHLWEESEEGELPPPGPLCLYARTRLLDLNQRAVLGILQKEGQRELFKDEDRRAAAELYKSFLEAALNPVGAEPGERTTAIGARGEVVLAQFDIAFRLRRLFKILYDTFTFRSNPDEEQRLRSIRFFLGRQIKLLEVIQTAMHSMLAEADFNWQGKDQNHERIWDLMEAAFKRLLHEDGENGHILPEYYKTSWTDQPPEKDIWLTQEELSRVNAVFRQRIDQIKRELQQNPQDLKVPAKFANVLHQTDRCEKRLLRCLMQPGRLHHQGQDDVDLYQAYERFMELDATLFPLQTFTEVYEKDFIKTVRLSPVDAQKGFSELPIEKKLAGDVVHHFGGFFKRSWRSNDILWGRLDGLGQLIESLMAPDRLQEVLEHAALRKKLQDRLAADLDPAKLFPHAGDTTHCKLRSWLEKLLSDNPDFRRQARENDFEEHLKLLIEAAQLEILQTELPQIISDAVEEEAQWHEWGAARKTTKRSPQPAEPDLNEITGRLALPQGGQTDSLVRTVAAEELARQAIAGLQQSDPSCVNPSHPSETRIGKFFKEKYKVGGEQLHTNVPLLILLDIIATTLLVMRNALLKAAGSKATKIKGNIIYAYVNGVLWSFYGLVFFLRQEKWKRLALVGVFLALIIIIAFFSWFQIALAIIIIPLLLALVGCWSLRRGPKINT